MATITGTGGPDLLNGTGDADSISGLAGDDTLIGGAGADTLDGGLDNDSMAGGAGDDLYRVDSVLDVVTEASSGGADTIRSSVTYTLPGNVETLILTGSAAINATGNGLANTITGNSGNNVLNGAGANDTLNGGLGNDTMIGGPGSDTYVVNAAGDVVTEAPSAGTDTIQSSVSRTLSANVEKLALTGSADINGTGNGLNNTLTGNSGNNVLNGATGNDTVIGGAGNDTLVWDPLDGSLQGGVGTDTLRVDGAGKVLDLTLVPDTRITDVEVVNLTGSGNNTLTLAGSDVLAISSTTNTLRVDGNAGDAVNAGMGWTQGADQVIGPQTYAVYTRGGATLQVDVDVDRGGIGVIAPEFALSSLNGENGFRIDGVAAYDFSGRRSVSGAGDVNGDGFDDLIIGAWGADQSGLFSGASYVVFGQAGGFGANLDLSSLNGANGFQIAGEAFYSAGFSVSGAGDVNGDGFDDLIVGAPTAGTPGAYNGAAYVVFGQASGFAANLNLSSLNGTNGFKITGVALYDYAGISVSGAGDVNGDGFDDLIIGASGADPNGDRSGASYVVFGQASGFGANLDLSSLNGANGFQIAGEALGDDAGFSVSGAGDVNGDGFDDLIVGAPGTFVGPPGAYNGTAYVVFGQAGGFGATLNLSSLNGTNGFKITGVALNDAAGISVSSGGDVNGDGFDDLIVGAFYADPNGDRSGASYVVFGQAGGFGANLDLSSLNGANGFKISGVAAYDFSGFSVSGAGDVNGDGFDDLIIGADGADPNGEVSGASYVVFGQAGGFAANINLSSLNGTNGFKISGVAQGDRSGSVSGAGDVNGDGFDDLIIGAWGADPNGSYSGASYVLFGDDFTGAVDFLGTTGNDALTGTAAAENFVSDVGNDTLTGGGGADVFRAGAGNDSIDVSSTGFADIDGGAGADTLFLTGSALTLNLTTLANSEIAGIERVDLTGSGNNTLTLAVGDVLDLSDSTNTLRVDGNAGDAVNAGMGWTQGADQVIGPQTYAVYTRGGATLQVDVDVDRSGIGVISPEFALSSLNGENGFQISGVAGRDNSGRSVSGAGDVNGDGFDDLIVGAPYADPNGTSSGASYVVFGQASGFSATLELSGLTGANGFQISGEAAYDVSGSVSGAGDVNGDGFDDLIIGASGADPNGDRSGASYVVFGQASGFGATLELSALNGTNGFQISGEMANDFSGAAFSGAGDVNGDGFDDLIIGASGADPNGDRSGASYVVFGQAGGFGANLNLSSLNGANGFQISGVEPYDYSGSSVSGAGDVNGDGFDDLIIGALGADPNGDHSGASYVVFGQASGFSATLELSALNGTNGFQISGVEPYDYSGSSVSGAGDVNGDGFDDLIIGALFDDPHGILLSGASYVVFGKASGFGATLELSSLDGTNGFQIFGEAQLDYSGRSVSGAGDVNGDGFDDLIISALGADPHGTSSGASYVVFGQASGFSATLELSSLDGTNGFQISGEAAYDVSGTSVSGAGDVNGDGFDDLIVGASLADPHGTSSGASYVVYGDDFTGAVDFLGTTGNDALTGTAAAENFVSDVGNDTLTGGGGADVFRAGAGNDSINVSSTGFADIDGGAGTDTLLLTGSGLTLNLTTLANSEIAGIEQVDLTGSGSNTLTLALGDVLDLSDSTDTLRVDGNAGDTVQRGAGWTQGADQVIGANTYFSYTQGLATLLVDTDITSVV